METYSELSTVFRCDRTRREEFSRIPASGAKPCPSSIAGAESSTNSTPRAGSLIRPLELIRLQSVMPRERMQSVLRRASFTAAPRQEPGVRPCAPRVFVCVILISLGLNITSDSVVPRTRSLRLRPGLTPRAPPSQWDPHSSIRDTLTFRIGNPLHPLLGSGRTLSFLQPPRTAPDSPFIRQRPMQTADMLFSATVRGHTLLSPHPHAPHSTGILMPNAGLSATTPTTFTAQSPHFSSWPIPAPIYPWGGADSLLTLSRPSRSLSRNLQRAASILRLPQAHLVLRAAKNAAEC
ncbi:hypothetical protein C8Q77DRAFT_658725 [Trametes polyzona]|nr:hypothetical protein C8Q77DRAFT_658725 [Trametes polyzona]